MLVFFLGCTQPVQTPPSPMPIPDETLHVQTGDHVAVNYVGMLDDGSMFDTNIREVAVEAGLPVRPGYAPLEFIVGSGQLIDGFDRGVIGMEVGEERNLTIPLEQAYGPIQQDLIATVHKEDIPFEVGLGGIVETPDGLQGRVTDIDGDNVTVDFNHPLAGKTLHFRVILVNISR